MLNATFEPLCVVSDRRAVVLVLGEVAEMLHASDAVMHSAHLAVAVPSVVRLHRYARVPYRWRTPLNRRSVFARDGHRCQYCGGAAESIDHVVPRSRGGAVLLLLLDRRQRGTSNRARAVALAALLVSASAFFITSEVLLERLDRSEIDAQGRKDIYALTARAVGDNPLLGFGYGAFEDGFKLYRDEPQVIENVRGLLESVFGAVFMVANAEALEEGAARMQPGLAVLDLTVARGNLDRLVERCRLHLTLAERMRLEAGREDLFGKLHRD